MTQYVLAAASFFDFSFITDFARKTFQSIEQARRARTTYNELNALTDAELRDIGISRSDIYAIAKGVY